MNKIVIIGLVIIALSFTAGLASSGFNFVEAAGGWKPAVDALLGQITGLGVRTLDLENEVFCSGNGTYDSGTELCTCNEGFGGDDCSETIPVCGNGIVEGGESCDDGNIVNGDGCSSTCQNEGGECAGEDAGTACGDPTDDFCTNPDTCDGSGNCLDNHESASIVCGTSVDQCTLDDFCDGNGSCIGSGFEASGTPCTDGLFCTGAEQCDDAGVCVSAGDPCEGVDGDANCSETCDETANACTGNDPNGSVCSLGFCDGDGLCFDFGVCGNNIVEGFEQCDDGNTVSGDGCSSICLIEDENGDPIIQCSNGLDDDGDGFVDFPNDPECTDPSDLSEQNLPQCSNGMDDDNDGFIDFPNDPGCTDASDLSE